MKVFCIIGESGCYSDYRLWIFGVSHIEDEAVKIVDLLNKETLKTKELSWTELHEYRKNAIDSNVDRETSYHYQEFDLEDIPKLLKTNKMS